MSAHVPGALLGCPCAADSMWCLSDGTGHASHHFPPLGWLQLVPPAASGSTSLLWGVGGLEHGEQSQVKRERGITFSSICFLFSIPGQAGSKLHDVNVVPAGRAGCGEGLQQCQVQLRRLAHFEQLLVFYLSFLPHGCCWRSWLWLAARHRNRTRYEKIPFFVTEGECYALKKGGSFRFRYKNSIWVVKIALRVSVNALLSFAASNLLVFCNLSCLGS